MKLKQQADDFRVEELTDLAPDSAGPFALYRLQKRGLGTPEAVQAVCRRWQLEFRRVSYGGLKDRHAVTSQFVTVWRGPRRGLKQEHLHLQYLGQLAEPFTPDAVRGNRFEVVLRDLDEDAVAFAETALSEAARDGVPNYFDDQRFGSIGRHHTFVARKLIDEDYEAALKLALVEPYEFDKAELKEVKRIVRERWGQWEAIRDRIRRGPVHTIIRLLVHRPTDFRGAFAALRDDLKSLYLAAYQSHIWNRLLAGWLQRRCRPEQLVTLELRLGRFPVFRNLGDKQRAEFRAQTLPLPSSRLKLGDDDPIKPLVDEILQEEGLKLSQMKLKHFREPFFAKGDRAAVLVPAHVEHEALPDDLNTGSQKLQLRFELPRGCYATMLVKRITVSG